MTRKYDGHAVEVLDDYGIPVLQLEIVDARTVRVGGIVCGIDHVTVIETMATLERPKSPDDLLRETKVARWFKYPSDLHLGQRVEPGR